MTKELRIGVISRISSKTIDTELAREARLRGHSYDRIAFDTVDLTQTERMFRDAKLLTYDVLYYRTSLGSVWARALERYLATYGRRAVNLVAIQFPFLNDKALQALTVSMAGILTPKTILDATYKYETITQELGTPFVAKRKESSQGKGVYLIHSEDAFRVKVERKDRNKYVYQEFIPHDYDCRIHLIDGKAAAGYRRIHCAEDFRCNVSLGASMEPLSSKDEEVLYPLAERVADVFGLEMHVVDFMVHKETKEYYFVEINDNPGWEMSDMEATGVDMSAKVIDSFEKACELEERSFRVGEVRHVFA
jgi:RimK family alpha-L-glutamate ligase